MRQVSKKKHIDTQTVTFYDYEKQSKEVSVTDYRETFTVMGCHFPEIDQFETFTVMGCRFPKIFC
jgi:hypothetical protein